MIKLELIAEQNKMLILTRKIGESIVINDNIIIKIVDIQGGQIRVGIDAPSNVEIYRKEIFDKINCTLTKINSP